MHLDHDLDQKFPHRHTYGAARPQRPDGTRRALRVGLGGPVGSGKTATVAALCRILRERLSLAVVTNDIYTREDAAYLLREAVLPPERITAVETGACPHTAIRDDISANLEAVEDLEDGVGPLDLILVESGGDNLTATFSKGLTDAQIFVIDVAGGDDIPRKGGPGVSTADLLVVNKTDLAPYVGSDLAAMARDAKEQRGELPVVFQSLRGEPGVVPVADWVSAQLAAWTGHALMPAELATRRQEKDTNRDELTLRPGERAPKAEELASRHGGTAPESGECAHPA